MHPEPTAAEGRRTGSVKIPYVAGLDGLRGAAVVAVLVFHGSHLQGGFLGVDLFFVLSGFLITSLLLSEGGATGHVGLAHFWERRARRLLPALGVLLVGVAAYARFVAAPEELHRIRFDGFATMLYVANWRAIFGKADYFALFSAPSPLEHTWSLAIEEQFYVVWPLVFVGLLILARRRETATRRSLAELALGLSLGLGLLSGAASLLLTRIDGWNRAYYGTDTRAFAILAGAAVAALRVRNGPVRDGWPRQLLEAGGIAGAVALGVCWTMLGFNASVTHRGGLLACSLAGAVVVAAVSHPSRGPVSRLASVAPLRWLGLISYGVYLYHWPIFVWLNADRVHLHGWPLFFVQCAVTGAAAVTSYFVIEQPIRHGSGWPKLTNVLVPAAGFAVVGLMVFAATTSTKLQLRPATTSASKALAAARANGGPKVMVIGDSVAWYLVRDGFSAVTTTPKMTVLSKAKAGCSYPGTESFRFPDGEIASQFTSTCNVGWYAAAEKFKPDYVIYVSEGASAADYFHDGSYISSCSPAFEKWTTRLYTEDAAAFARTGAKVVLVTSATPQILFVRPNDKQAQSESTSCGNRVLKEVAAAHPNTVEVIDLEAHLCTSEGTCRKTQDGVVLRDDGLHYRGKGAPIIASWLLSQLGIHTTSS